MKNKFARRIKKFLSCSVIGSPNHETRVDVREEYANAFRTESYIEFWTRVVTYSKSNSKYRSTLSRESTTSATRLPSYRLFAEHLLDPDQLTITQILAQTKLRPEIHSLLSDYFTHTSNAFLLCSHLLKDIEGVRIKYKSLKNILQCWKTNKIPSPKVVTHLIDFTNSLNPFTQTGPSPCRIRAINCNCSELQKRLELSRDKTRGKMKMIVRLKHCSTCAIVIVITASLVVFVVAHGFALLMAMPGFVSMKLGSKRKLAKVTAQLDAAAKGTYIVNKDLETTSRLVARLNDELEYMKTRVKFWLERKEDRVQADCEVVRLLKKNQCSFSDQLDELEEHLYLCFMTINRARDLVLNQITDLA